MSRPKPTAEDLEARVKRATQVKEFCTNNKYTEKKLAETLGVSRRSIQMVKAGGVTPNKATIGRLEALFSKYNGSKKKD